MDQENISENQSTHPSARLSSQADVHLEHRVRLGLLSVLLDEVSTMTEEEINTISLQGPQKLMEHLVGRHTTPTKINGNSTAGANDCDQYKLFDWKSWQPHRHFVGTNLLLVHASLSVFSPLLLGMFQKEVRAGVQMPGTVSWGKNKCRYVGKKTIDDGNSRESPEVMLALAIQTEQYTQQTPWGKPMPAVRNQVMELTMSPCDVNNEELSPSFSNARMKVTDNKSLGIKNGRHAIIENSWGVKGGSADESVATKELSTQRKDPLFDKDLQEHPTHEEPVPWINLEAQIPMTYCNGSCRKAKSKHVKFADGNLENSVSIVGSKPEMPIVLDSDSDTDSSESINDSQPSSDRHIFHFRRGSNVLSLQIDNIAASMKDVLEAATALDSECETKVFHRIPAERLGFRIEGLTCFTKEHFVTLTAHDILVGNCDADNMVSTELNVDVVLEGA